jgi:hypothetical protein
MTHIVFGPAIVILCAAPSFAEELLIPYTAFPDLPIARKVKEVVDHYTFHRALNANRFKSTAKVFDYLLDRMPLTSVIMRHMGIEKYEITVGEDGVMTYDDKQGMVGTFIPAYAEGNKRVFYGDGSFDTGILGAIRGQSVVVMDCSQEEPQLICNRVVVFIRVRGLLAPLCKIASPILNGMVTRKSGALLKASTILSEQLTDNPEGVYEEIRDCEAIRPEELLDFREAFLSNRD